MNKSLPNTIKNSKGFSLIEILVAVSIIAILSVIAVAMYTTIQQDARDGKRTSELGAIANALEINKPSAGYASLLNTQFGGSTYPGRSLSTDTTAIGPNGDFYCIISNSTTAPTLAQWPNPGVCPTTPAYVQVGNGTPTAGATSWSVCTRMENPAAVVCKINNQ